MSQRGILMKGFNDWRMPIEKKERERNRFMPNKK
jgi:hypothetical protein